MKTPIVLLAGFSSLLFSFALNGPVRAAEDKPVVIAGVSRAEALRLGERMYREGILPSGGPMRAVVKGDIPVTGTAFTCLSCHLRSGLGSVEGGIVTPPTNGSYLYKPLRQLHKGIEISSAPVLRPAYTDASLADALRGGLDPSGRRLNEVMPRYLLQDNDMAILIFYLKSLSSQFSPGVSDTTLRFATVITDDVDPASRDAMIIPLEKFITYKNNQAAYYETRAGVRSARMAESMLLSPETAYKRLSLARWLLKGPPDTWRGQLEEYYRREPVFALLGGMAKNGWQPVHRFSEDNRIPCILPITDLPVISDTDWHTLYFSKGLYQEGEGAARYLNSIGAMVKGGPVLQLVRASREGRALSAGFQETWRGLGHQAPVTVTLRSGETATMDSLLKVLSGEKPSVVLLWDGPETLASLEAWASSGQRPEMVFVSSSYVGKGIWTLPDEARGFTYLTYPFRLPRDEERYTGAVESFMGMNKVQGDALIILKKVYSAVQVLSQALMDMKGNYYRDNLLDVIGTSMGAGGMDVAQDRTYPLYERFSLGPGQRYASKGCYIVQLTKGPGPELVKKSDWVIH